MLKAEVAVSQIKSMAWSEFVVRKAADGQGLLIDDISRYAPVVKRVLVEGH
jgi:hypothetical protein